MRSVSTYKNVTFIYDFAVDGGAEGVFNTGVFVPPQCMPVFVISQPILDFVSPDGIFKIGTAAVNDTFLSEVPVINFNNGAGEAGFKVATRIISTVGAGGELLLELTGGVITEGAIKFACTFQEY